MRQLSLVDNLIAELDRGVKTISGVVKGSRPMPVFDNKAIKLSQEEADLSIALMRVNHVGEVCAQALYFGQSLTSSDLTVKDFLLNSAKEEEDHLDWCQQRLKTLNGRISYLNPIWYGGSFVLGGLAGLAGTAWGLGFVKATEEQVEAHLESHLSKLPKNDLASKAVIQQMIVDEKKHADEAKNLGAKDLPEWLQNSMQVVAKFMTNTAYWL